MRIKGKKKMKNGAVGGYVYYSKEKKWKWRIVKGPSKKGGNPQTEQELKGKNMVLKQLLEKTPDIITIKYLEELLLSENNGPTKSMLIADISSRWEQYYLYFLNSKKLKECYMRMHDHLSFNSDTKIESIVNDIRSGVLRVTNGSQYNSLECDIYIGVMMKLLKNAVNTNPNACDHFVRFHKNTNANRISGVFTKVSDGEYCLGIITRTFNPLFKNFIKPALEHGYSLVYLALLICNALFLPPVIKYPFKICSITIANTTDYDKYIKIIIGLIRQMIDT